MAVGEWYIETDKISSKLVYCVAVDDGSGVALQGDRGPSGIKGLKGDSVAVAQWLRASNIFRQLCSSTSEWRGFEFRWVCRSGFEFTKTKLKLPSVAVVLVFCGYFNG